MKKVFDISGMTCAACAAQVEKVVGRVDGVTSARVNLLANMLEVEGEFEVGAILEAVDDAGFVGTERAEKESVTFKKENGVDKKSEPYFTPVKTRLIVSVIFLVPLLYVAMGHMIKAPLPNFLKGVNNGSVFILLQMLLTLPILYVNRRFFYYGFKRLFKGAPNMDTLIAIGSGAAFVYGVAVLFIVSYYLGHGETEKAGKFYTELYFESAGTILTLITVGKYLEDRAKKKTTDALTKLVGLTPKTATVIKDGAETTVGFDEIAVGDVLAVKAGETLPVDGVVVEGSANFDMSAINGESMPVLKTAGDYLMSGGINTDGYVRYRAMKVGKDTTVNKIVALVEEANMTKAPISRLADKISAVFVPIVMTAALIAFIVWAAVSKDVGYALSIGVSVLVVSCPCALGLATPLAIMVGTGLGAKSGILIKNAESLEILCKTKTVVLDKTGTLTTGTPTVTDAAIFDEYALDAVGSIEKMSSHPIAKAVVKYALAHNYREKTVSDYVNTVGKGIEGTVDGKRYFIGSASFMAEKGVEVGEYGLDGAVYVGSEGALTARFICEDELRKDSAEGVRLLREDGKKVIMLTGDNAAAAERIKDKLGLDRAVSGVLPDGKRDEVESLQKDGTVVMVGDGINDSVALSQADVGIAMAGGTDIAVESADVVLMNDRVSDVHKAVKLSKKTVAGIKGNLLWAFVYNAIGIPVAAGALIPVGIKMSPMIAALAMSLSSLFVVLNTLRMKITK